MEVELNLIALGIFVVSATIYGILLFVGIRNPKSSKRGLLNIFYEHWVEVRLDGSALVAIQATRNLIMANSVFISGLLVLLGIVLGFYSTIFNDEILVYDLSIGVIQVALVFIIVIFCLFNFVLAIRMLVRFTLLVSAEPEELYICGQSGLSFTKKTLVSAQRHWSYGLRCLFYLVAILSWIIDSRIFIASTILVTIYLIFFEDILLGLRRDWKSK